MDRSPNDELRALKQLGLKKSPSSQNESIVAGLQSEGLTDLVGSKTQIDAENP